MQLRRIRYAVLPAQLGKQVEGYRELTARFRKCGGLGGRWLQLDANSSLHMYNITYRKGFPQSNTVYAPPILNVLRIPAARLASSPSPSSAGATGSLLFCCIIRITGEGMRPIRIGCMPS